MPNVSLLRRQFVLVRFAASLVQRVQRATHIIPCTETQQASENAFPVNIIGNVGHLTLNVLFSTSVRL